MAWEIWRNLSRELLTLARGSSLPLGGTTGPDLVRLAEGFSLYCLLVIWLYRCAGWSVIKYIIYNKISIVNRLIWIVNHCNTIIVKALVMHWNKGCDQQYITGHVIYVYINVVIIYSVCIDIIIIYISIRQLIAWWQPLTRHIVHCHHWHNIITIDSSIHLIILIQFVQYLFLKEEVERSQRNPSLFQ